MTNPCEQRERKAERFRFLAAVYGVVPTIVRMMAEDVAELQEASFLYGEAPSLPSPRAKLVCLLIPPTPIGELHAREAESYVEALKYMLANPNDPEVITAADHVARTPIPMPRQSTYVDALQVLWQCGAYPRR